MIRKDSTGKTIGYGKKVTPVEDLLVPKPGLISGTLTSPENGTSKKPYAVDKEKLQQLLNQEVTLKQICENQGWKYSTGGNVKKAQFKALDSACVYTDNGKTGKAKRYIIQEIKGDYDLDNVKKVLSEKDLTNLVAKEIMFQMMLESTQKGTFSSYDGYWFVTNKELTKLVGLATKPIDYIQMNPKKYAEEKQFNVEIVRDVVKINYAYINKIIGKALTYLQSKTHIISYIANAYILETDMIVIQEDGEVVPGHFESEPIYPTLKTIEWINSTAIPLALKEAGYVSMPSDDKLRNNFYNEILPKWIRCNCTPEWFRTGNPQLKLLVAVKAVWKCHRIRYDWKVIGELLQDQKICKRMFGLAEDEMEQFKLECDQILQQLAKNLECDETINSTIRDQINTTLNVNLQDRHIAAINGTSQASQNVVELRKLPEYVIQGKQIIRDSHRNDEYRYFEHKNWKTQKWQTGLVKKQSRK